VSIIESSRTATQLDNIPKIPEFPSKRENTNLGVVYNDKKKKTGKNVCDLGRCPEDERSLCSLFLFLLKGWKALVLVSFGLTKIM